MNKKNIGLRAAHSANNIVELHAATESSTVKNDELSAKLVAGRSRREHALKSSSNLDKALSALQERYVVCAEPPAIYDLKLHKPLKEQGFKLYHRSPKFRPPEGDKKRALGEIFLDHPDTTRCSCLSFRPGRPTIDGDFLNLWTPPDIHEVEGDISPFIEHMDYVFDGQQESINYALDWMALPLQKPGSKMESAILLVGKQGTGKTTLGEICRRSHGLSNSAKIKGEDLLKDFNEYMMKATFVSVEEVFLKGRWDLMDRIKDTITSTKTRINIKHVSPYEIENVANFMLFSNHANALAISDDDRRWHVHVSHQPPKDKLYYAQLYNWLECELGHEKIYYHLMHRDLSNFSRHSKPPMTQCKKDMAFASKSDIEQRISDDIEDREGLFASDLVVLGEVYKHYAQTPTLPTSREITDMKYAMSRLAANTGRRVRYKTKIQPNSTTGDSLARSNERLWSVRNHDKWREADPAEMRKELKKTHPNIILEEE